MTNYTFGPSTSMRATVSAAPSVGDKPAFGSLQASGDKPGSAVIKDTTTAGFRQDVIAESMKQPVLVDFWAPWCGPCKQLTPVIEKVVAATGGKVKLVKLNIDDHPQIPGQLGIQSIPAVIAFSKGQPVDGFMGAVPESQIHTFIDSLFGPSPAEIAIAEALAKASDFIAAGDLANANSLYAAVLTQDPQNMAALTGTAKLHVEAGDLDAARSILDKIAPEQKDDPLVVGARAAIELSEQAAKLGDLQELQSKVDTNPGDHQLRFDLALALNACGKREEGLDHLLDIVRRDRTWNDDGARKQVVQFFEAWGPMDEVTIAGRRKLSAVLFA
jgi:putative thioredoxin